MNNSQLYEIEQLLRTKAKEIKIQRQRVKSVKRWLDDEIKANGYEISIVYLPNNQYRDAADLSREVCTLERRLESMHRLDFYLASDQRAIGKCIVEANRIREAVKNKSANWYVEKLRDKFAVDALKRLTYTPYYKMHHYEFPNGW